LRSHLSSLAALLLPLFLFASPAFGDSLELKGQLVYDNDLQIYWMQNAHSSGIMTWQDANNWANNLTYGGYSDWHLPTTPDGFYKNGNFVWIYDKDNNETKINVTFSDLGHLFYSHLNTGEKLVNISKEFFNNQLLAQTYWLDKQSATSPVDAWAFNLASGTQSLRSTNNKCYAIAVRSAVPEPASALLFVSGLTGTLWYLRRKRK
jgi:hypothetical protein